MNLLHVVSNLDPESGGPAEALRGLAIAQANAGLRVNVLATWKRDADLRFIDDLRAAGIDVRLIGPCYGPLCWRHGLTRSVRDVVRGVDVVHIHSLWEEIQHQAALAATQYGKPYLIRPCGMLDPWSLKQSKWKKAIYLWWRLRRDLNDASSLHFTTTIERDLTKPLGLKAPSLIEPNGIRISEFHELPKHGAFRHRLAIPDTSLICLFLGRVHPKKGLDLLLPAFALLDRSVHLIVAGPVSTDYRVALEAEVSRLQIKERVHFVGMLRGPEKLAAFSDADLFVLPSRQENFGNAVVEALAAGVPVVISNQVNLWPDIKNAAVGGVVPLEIEALAREIGRWLADSKLRAITSERAKTFARESFDWDAIAKRWALHYSRLTLSPKG